MPLVSELTASFENVLISPRHGEDVCRICFNITDGYARCYQCSHGGHALDAMAPISYSIAGEQLHLTLAGYKRFVGPVARRMTLGLAAVLWRHLAEHEVCIAREAGVDRFTLVTSVPSRTSGSALQDLVTLVGPVRDRYAPVLVRSGQAVTPHQFDGGRYCASGDVQGASVLLIDDMWTTGASAQSAAAALKAAGATCVAALVIGRHVHRSWGRCDSRLRGLAQPFDWAVCPLCTNAQARSAA